MLISFYVTMQTEFEVKILDVNVDEIKTKLNSLGAKFIKEKFQRRLTYDFTPIKEGSWVRLRTDGKKTTLCIKEIHNDLIDGTKELEIVVDDFEKTNLILEKLGYSHKAYQENKRISYTLDDVEIEIDFWPKIPPYVEIEGKSVEEVEKMVKKLGFQMSQTTSLNTESIYSIYCIDERKIKELKFE